MGDALGHSWVGLLLARAIDPALQTPVPLAFTYKLLVRREGGRETVLFPTNIQHPPSLPLQVFFAPGSGGKNNIVISLIDAWGLWPAFCVCLSL